MAYELNDNEIPHGYDSLEAQRNRHLNPNLNPDTGSLDHRGPQHNDWVHYRMLNLAGPDLLECERTALEPGQQTTLIWDAVTCPHCVTSIAQSWAGFCEFAPPLDPQVYHSSLEDVYDAPTAESLEHLWDGSAVPTPTLDDEDSGLAA